MLLLCGVYKTRTSSQCHAMRIYLGLELLGVSQRFLFEGRKEGEHNGEPPQVVKSTA